MATAYTEYLKYRDPEKLDISVLGKAMQYKQQNYDQNVAQTQQLVNQYAGTDLLKDIDKEYFGQRINTLVNFINESGTRDWSKKSIVNSIQSYIGGALDEKVINAIGSTKSYRNQMAAIEEIKKSKPELWSQQNQDFATRDLDRYLSSTEAGDKYQAQTYTNYKDVQKTILDNSKMLKDYGVEYHFDPIGGNAYFKQIGKSERIAPEKAKQYLDMMMTPDMQNQLAIDGWYTYRGIKDEELNEKYQGTLDATLDYTNKRKGELSLALLSAPNSQKSVIEQNIALLDQNISNIKDKKQQPFNRNQLVNQMYQENFYNKNVSFLSYDKVIDTFVDDSEFKVAKFDHERQNDDRDYNQKINEFNHKLTQDNIDNQFKVEKAALDRRTLDLKEREQGLKYDSETGQYIGNGISQIPITDEVVDQDKAEKPDGFISAKNAYNDNMNATYGKPAEEIRKAMDNPKNEKLFGKLKELGWDYKTLINHMVNKKEGSPLVYNLLSEESKTIIDNAKSSASAMKSVDANFKGIREDVSNIVAATDKKDDNFKKIYSIANNGYVVDNSGNVLKGDVNKLDILNSDAVKKIAIYNTKLMQGNLSKTEEEKFKYLIKGEIRNMKNGSGKNFDVSKQKDIYDKMVYQEQTKGFWQTAIQAYTMHPLGKLVASSIQTNLNMLDIGLNKIYDTDDSELGKKFNDFTNLNQKENYNNRTFTNEILNWQANKKRFNEDLNSIGASDLSIKDKDGKIISMDKIQERWKNESDAISNTLSDYKYDINKAANINTETKLGKEMMPYFQSVLPIGIQVQSNSNMKVVMDQKTGLATITASVKDGKEYETQTFAGIKMSELPPQLLSSIKTESDNKVYSANNPYAVPYKASIELDTNTEEYLRKIDLLPERERYDAMQNPPINKTDIIKQSTILYGEDKLKEHQVEINKIIHTPIDVTTEASNGKWSIVARQAGTPIYMSQPQDETYDRNLINQLSKTLVPELINKRIASLMGVKVN